MSRRDDFKTVISEWLIEELPLSIRREIEVPLSTEVIVSITGPRRAGKTFLMYDIIGRLIKDMEIPKWNILYINFEHERLRNLDANDLEDMMTAFYELSQIDRKLPLYLFLDEIQNVRDWNKWINRMYEKKLFKIYISGSSSKLLSRELSTELRGRSIDIPVLPLSFREFLKFKNIRIENIELLVHSELRGDVLRRLLEYMEKGSYPEITKIKDDIFGLLRSYLDTTIIKDVGERFRIEPSILRSFVEYAIDNYAKYMSGTKIYNYLKTLNYKISREFPLLLLSYFNEVFAIFPIEIFSYSIKSKKQYPKKLYVVDTGFIHIVSRKIEYGRLMENIVFLELYRRSDALKNFSIGYWKEYGTSEGKEVDFVIIVGNKVKELINVTYSSSKEEINKRETESLIKAGRELGCKNMNIITWDYFENGEIQYIPLWYWLMAGQDST